MLKQSMGDPPSYSFLADVVVLVALCNLNVGDCCSLVGKVICLPSDATCCYQPASGGQV